MTFISHSLNQLTLCLILHHGPLNISCTVPGCLKQFKALHITSGLCINIIMRFTRLHHLLNCHLAVLLNHRNVRLTISTISMRSGHPMQCQAQYLNPPCHYLSPPITHIIQISLVSKIITFNNNIILSNLVQLSHVIQMGIPRRVSPSTERWNLQ